jgi:hypothetical protein
VIGHEESIEPATFHGLSKALDMPEIEIRVRICAGIASGGDMDG